MKIHVSSQTSHTETRRIFERFIDDVLMRKDYVELANEYELDFLLFITPNEHLQLLDVLLDLHENLQLELLDWAHIHGALFYSPIHFRLENGESFFSNSNAELREKVIFRLEKITDPTIVFNLDIPELLNELREAT